MNDTYINVIGTVLPKTLYQQRRCSIILCIVVMIAFPAFMVYCAVATENTFWGCIGIAILWFFAFALLITKALKDNRFAHMTFSRNENCIINQTLHRTNSISLNEAFYSMEVTIPFYVGRGRTAFPYLVFAKTEETLSAGDGYYGLSALKQLHEAGAVLIPKEACAKTFE